MIYWVGTGITFLLLMWTFSRFPTKKEDWPEIGSLIVLLSLIWPITWIFVVVPATYYTMFERINNG